MTDERVSYVLRYGGRCRDCADEDGVCPHSGLPCAGAEKAVRFVLGALDYGYSHGFLNTVPAPDTASAIAWLEEAARYFESRPVNGEDAAHWSNAANADSARKIVKLLDSPCKNVVSQTLSETFEPKTADGFTAPVPAISGGEMVEAALWNLCEAVTSEIDLSGRSSAFHMRLAEALKAHRVLAAADRSAAAPAPQQGDDAP